MPEVTDKGTHCAVVYFGRCSATYLIKIGTTCSLIERIRALRSRHEDFDYFALLEGDRDRESEIHHYFKYSRQIWRGEREWFRPHWRLQEFIKMNASKYGYDRPLPRFLRESWQGYYKQHLHAKGDERVPRVEPLPKFYRIKDLCKELNIDRLLLADFIKCEHLTVNRELYTEEDLEKLRALLEAWNNRIHMSDLTRQCVIPGSF